MTTTSQPLYILDISRLLSRAGKPFPTGIDRVELVYAHYLLTHKFSYTRFAAINTFQSIKIIPNNKVKEFIDTLISIWNIGDKNKTIHVRKIALKLKFLLLIAPKPKPTLSRSFYLLLSHHHLIKKSSIQKFLKYTQSFFIPMVHDLIPIEYPEYSHPREYKRHIARIRNVVALSDGVIVPTNAVRSSLLPYFEISRRNNIRINVVNHGINEHPIAKKIKNEHNKPFFIYLSTIEPRKNHLTLLHIWRNMVKTRGEENTPNLILIGKRGWENENILDLLERCPALTNVIIEHNNLSDEEVLSLMQNSNGLLFPSFSEGYGLPLAEAMYLGIPSICSNIPALHEVGGNIPLYCDPLDSNAWQQAIDDFTNRGPLWQRQKRSLVSWKPFTWQESIAQSLEFCQNLSPKKRRET